MSVPLIGPRLESEAVTEAVAYLRSLPPEVGLRQLWRNHELRGEDGRRHVLPVLALSPSGLWLIQPHAQVGSLVADDEVWLWEGRGDHIEDNPLKALDERARSLRRALARAGLPELPVRPLLLLGPQVQLKQPRTLRRPDLAHGLAAIEGVNEAAALLRAGPEGWSVSPEQAERLAEVLPAAGVLPIPGSQLVGGYRLVDEVLAESEHWQEHLGVDPHDPSRRARVRTWVLGAASDERERAALRRAAEREAEVLARLGQHPSILSLLGTEAHPDAPRLIFEDFAGAHTLHQLIRSGRALTLDQRLELLEKIAGAVEHCHRHDITHRNICPDAVLVRITGERVEVRLHHFEGAVARQADATTLGTRHLTRFSEIIHELYRAPEVLNDPDAASPLSDLFSLGALAYYVFAETHPGPMPHRVYMLKEMGALYLWEHRDDYDDELVEHIASATRKDLNQRPSGVGPWIRQLVALYRDDEAEDAARVDPLQARRGDTLAPDVLVEAELGTGASARVLAVRSHGELRALKVPHDPDHVAMLEAEQGVLRRLSEPAHPNIVREYGLIELSGRRCLLLQHAGEDTLADRVRREGPLPLDYARRLGEELLSALMHLSAQGITHRDIKPANLAFASLSNQAVRLVLFDFSIASLPADQIRMGTPGWRDPVLDERAGWDAAADLFAAAAVLYYAITGERPRFDYKERRVPLSEARFDPSLRGALATFFQRAFSAELGARYPDAEAARAAWSDIFERDVTSQPRTEEGELAPRLARARLDTRIGALGLSAVALNALERAGVVTVRDLLGLPRNRLSLVRGVGQQTRQQIVEVVDALRGRLGGREDLTLEPFLPLSGLPRQRLEQAELGLSPEALEALRDAGLPSVRDLGEAAAGQVERVLAPHGVDLDALRQALRACVPDTPIAGVLGDWVAALLRPSPRGKRRRWEERLAALLGLDPLPVEDTAPPGGRGNAQVAQALNDSPVVFRSSFQKARSHWEAQGELRDAALAAVGAALDRLGPAAPIPEVARALLEAEAPALVDEPRALTQAIALVRWSTELDLPHPPMHWQLVRRQAWLARRAERLSEVQALAAHTDHLAALGQALPKEVAAHQLRAHVEGPLADLPDEQLLQLAAKASDQADLSPRLELYPVGLPALRALELASAVLGSGLRVAEVQERVRARFPKAQSPPERPELDGLLERVGLRWSAAAEAYVRPGAQGATATRRSVASTRLTTGGTTPDPGRMGRFDAALRHSLESGRFRVIQVSARRAEHAARALSRAVPELRVTDLDAALWRGIRERVQALEADWDFVLGIDRAGPEGEHWGVFLEHFVSPVVDTLINVFLSPEGRAKPRLLVHPGLLARYGQAAALDTLVQRVEAEEGKAVWLLLPAWDDGGNPLLRHPLGDLPVPTWLPAQRLRAPRAWISRTLEP